MPLYTIETSGELKPGLDQEWLLTNGIGGFASSTVVGCNTRRYHGLLCAATKPPVGRVILLSRIGEIVKLDGKPELLELSVNCFRENVHPRGDRFLRRFEVDDIARFEFNVSGVTIVKEVQILTKRNVTLIRYTIEPNGHEVELNLLPFVAMRDFHALRRRGRMPENFDINTSDHHVSVRQNDLSVWLHCDEAEYVHEPDWWSGHVYPIETERGQDDEEDLFKPGMFVFRTSARASITLIAATDHRSELDFDADLKHHEAMQPPSTYSPTIRRLMHAANDFIVERKAPDGKRGFTVIAGYPWFADWGRDTMIALPGLFLATGRFV